MPKFRVASKELEKVDGVAVKVGDEITLSGRAARRHEAAGHIVPVKGEVVASAPAAVPAKRGARKAAKKSR